MLLTGRLAKYLPQRFGSPARCSALVLLLAAACATNPATGAKELSFVSEGQEVSLGRRGAEEALRALQLVPDSTVQRYVRGVAAGLLQAAERPTLPWTFHVLDDATVNAFAYPGGYIFLTRGILTHMHSEAELAGVLGHEIGHVTARHGASQMTRSQMAMIGLAVGSAVSPTFRDLAGAATGGLGLLFLRYGRDAEHQADELGYRYMTLRSYDPRGMSSMLTMLQRQAGPSAKGRLPEWTSTHPDPEDRVARNDRRVARFPGRLDTTRVDRDTFLRLLDGMVFGENPREGYFEGNVFLHPDLRFRVAFPTGWTVQNQPASVVAMSEAKDAMATLGLAQASSPAAALRTFLGQEGVQAGPTSSAPVNGLPAATGEFRAQTQQGNIAGAVQYLQHEGRIYQLLLYTTADRTRYQTAFRQTLGSFARLTDPGALNRQPVRVKMVRLDRDMSLREFQRSYPSALSLQYLAVINGVDTTTRLERGRWVKQVR